MLAVLAIWNCVRDDVDRDEDDEQGRAKSTRTQTGSINNPFILNTSTSLHQARNLLCRRHQSIQHGLYSRITILRSPDQLIHLLLLYERSALLAFQS